MFRFPTNEFKNVQNVFEKLHYGKLKGLLRKCAQNGFVKIKVTDDCFEQDGKTVFENDHISNFVQAGLFVFADNDDKNYYHVSMTHAGMMVYACMLRNEKQLFDYRANEGKKLQDFKRQTLETIAKFLDIDDVSELYEND